MPELFPKVLVLPIARKPLFPKLTRVFNVRDPNVCKAIEKLVASGQPYVGAFMTKDDDSIADTVTDLSQIYRYGVFSQITHVAKSDDGEGLVATLLAHRRIRIDKILPELDVTGAEEQTNDNLHSASSDKAAKLISGLSVTKALVANVHDEPCNVKNPMVKALTSEILSCIKEIIQFNPSIKEQIALFSYTSGANLMEQPAMLADFAASLVAFGGSKELQSVMDSLVVEERMQKTLILLKKEVSNCKVQHRIDEQVKEKMEKTQKEYYLMESMKGIQRELGLENDGRDKLIKTLKDRAATLKFPEEVKTVFDEELAKFSTLEPSAFEFSITRNYLDWLTQVPWGKRSQENFDITKARAVLNEDHYGMKDVKDRILEFIAVGKLKSSVQGKILLLSGPPGTGKTSIGKSIAKSLNREFYRFSVGGLNDVSEIKGHRRTYVGAMPGKLVQALKKVQTENPLILIDEVDKMSRNGFRGDPASALLEVLDPEQNVSFADHFMDVPIDLSKVLFVCTANVLDTIPGPLLDRMEIIQLSGYVSEEKIAIAEKYLEPQARKSTGIKKEQVNISKSALEILMQQYCRESGVRNLKKHIEKIYRKSALKLVRDNPVDIQVNPENLKDFVGNPVFDSDRLHDKPPPGVVTGLAWTGMGGTVLYIESISGSSRGKDDKKAYHPSFVQSGQLGDVMKESTNIAYTYAKSYMAKHDSKNSFFRKNSLHLHVPEGATPKDGPSAGVSMTTSLLSLALGQPVPPTIAMTGEITLTGKVLKIGGVKEKIIAAKRAGATTVIMPMSNRPDFEDIEDYIKSGLDVKFAQTYEDIIPIVFPSESNESTIQ